MASNTYTEINKKELAQVVHKLARLGVHLLDLIDRRGVMMNRVGSSLLSNLKGK